MKLLHCLWIGAWLGALSLLGQSQISYSGTNATGKVTLSATVNLLQKAQGIQSVGFGVLGPEINPNAPARRLRPPITQSVSAASLPNMTSMAINVTSGFGFNGLTHFDQRQANNGNQFSTEPGMPAVAAGNGFVMLTVADAIQVYSTAGVAQLPTVVTFNQLFGLPPAIDRSTNLRPGPFLTDMRSFYDADINRWLVVARAQLTDLAGNALAQSRIWIAASQDGNPLGNYNIYVIDSTNSLRSGCPCIADYLLIGADKYGFYITANEFNVFSLGFVDSIIFAISKDSLRSGAGTPTTFQFQVPSFAGFGFAIQPAFTPPGGSYFLASNGVEFFVSSISTSSAGSSLAVWAMTNTGSLFTASPNLSLVQIYVPSQTYIQPNPASQRFGSIPLGSTFFPAFTPFIDGGDLRIQSLFYAGGRLYATLATQVLDEQGKVLVGGAYFIMSPTLRGGQLAASMNRQGYLLVKNNSLLRSTVAVNPQGRGAIVFTLVGPDHFPSVAFVPIDNFSTGSAIQVVAPGALPEDGFTGYPGSATYPIARWGDSAGAVAASDGSIWMTTEFIPNLPRTQFANWGTFLARYIP